MTLLRAFKPSEMSILTKLVITFLMLILPLYGTGLLLNEAARKEVARQISDNLQNQLHNFLTTFENEIGRIDDLQRGFVDDRDLQNLNGLDVVMSSYERMMAINRLLVRVDFMRRSSPYLRDVTIYMPDSGRTLSASNQSSAFERTATFDYVAGIEPSRPLHYRDGRMFITPFMPASYGNQPPYRISVELSVSHIRSMLSAFNPDGGMILFGDGWSVTNGDDAGEAGSGSRAGSGATPAFLALARTDGGEAPTVREFRTFSAKVAGTDYFLALERSPDLQASLLVYIPQDRALGVLKKNRGWMWTLSAVSVLLIIIFAYGIFLLIHIPLRKLVKAFRAVEEGRFDLAIKRGQKDEFGYLYGRFESMVGKLKSLIDELYVQKIRLQQSEFKQLQSQVNPHFLYNSFFILDRLIDDEDFAHAKPLSKYLGDYYQYVTRNALTEMPLIDEYNHARAYMEIQKIRFDDRIALTVEPLPPAYHRVMVPRLLLQPCMENAYEHGLSEKIKGGLLEVRCEEKDDRLVISIEDNGDRLDEATLRRLEAKLDTDDAEMESTGLINVHRRLLLRFGSRGGIRISRGQLGGLRVEVAIPHDGQTNL